MEQMSVRPGQLSVHVSIHNLYGTGKKHTLKGANSFDVPGCQRDCRWRALSVVSLALLDSLASGEAAGLSIAGMDAKYVVEYNSSPAINFLDVCSFGPLSPGASAPSSLRPAPWDAARVFEVDVILCRKKTNLTSLLLLLIHVIHILGFCHPVRPHHVV